MTQEFEGADVKLVLMSDKAFTATMLRYTIPKKNI
jgi:hypothetical protein